MSGFLDLAGPVRSEHQDRLDLQEPVAVVASERKRRSNRCAFRPQTKMDTHIV